MTTTIRQFAAPAALPGAVLIQAEALWNAHSATDDTDDRLADLLGLGSGDGHDELTRCDVCDAWFWADGGATVQYESGRELEMCAEHAVADDPGARVYPGIGLEAAWRVEQDARDAERIRATGRPW